MKTIQVDLTTSNKWRALGISKTRAHHLLDLTTTFYAELVKREDDVSDVEFMKRCNDICETPSELFLISFVIGKMLGKIQAAHEARLIVCEN